jgi:hypothetical protein
MHQLVQNSEAHHAANQTNAAKTNAQLDASGSYVLQ